jgi:pyruvate/2-oxoglutarate dehydrogenase complex dihydrolipoamide dehydrogenase (E3) component
MNVESLVQPVDIHNLELVSNVHPPDWKNPDPAPRYNLVVVGGGTAGLVTAAGAAGLSAKVALVERHLLGGDCLNVGCVPSKAIIRSSRIHADILDARRNGLRVNGETEVDFSGVMERMRRLRAGISHHDSARRFQEMGVDVFLGDAHFSGPDAVEVEGKTLRFKKAVIATGSRPVEPGIDGLAEAGFLTNETVFSLTERPRRLAILGGGPIGCELAQAFRRLGSEVILFHSAGHILNREDSDAAEILQKAFVQEGIRLILGCKTRRVERRNNEKVIHFECQGRKQEAPVDEILVGTGRTPDVEGLHLEAAGVKYDGREGVIVNDYLQTTNPSIYAAGDISLQYKFTHTADAAARIVIQNALFRGRKKLSALTIPWCTYTDPEIAHVGIYERDAKGKGIVVDTFTKPFSEVDRAVLDGEKEGFVKIHVKKGTDKILGATIVARHAGEMISEITLAVVANLGLKTLTQVIHPYPTQADALRQVADAYNRTRLTPFVKKLFNRWLTWTR